MAAEVSKTPKSVKSNLTFIFIELSKRANSFVKIRLVFEIKNVASFIKTRCYWKRGCVKMFRDPETFLINKG